MGASNLRENLRCGPWFRPAVVLLAVCLFVSPAALAQTSPPFSPGGVGPGGEVAGWHDVATADVVFVVGGVLGAPGGRPYEETSAHGTMRVTVWCVVG
jgi:hypothetical protein